MIFAGTRKKGQEPQRVILSSAATKPALNGAEGNLASGRHKRQNLLRLRRIRMTDKGRGVPCFGFLGGEKGRGLCP